MEVNGKESLSWNGCPVIIPRAKPQRSNHTICNFEVGGHGLLTKTFRFTWRPSLIDSLRVRFVALFSPGLDLVTETSKAYGPMTVPIL